MRHGLTKIFIDCSKRVLKRVILNIDSYDGRLYILIETFCLLDDIVTTELIYKKCVKHIEMIEHRGSYFKPDDWAIVFAALKGNIIQMKIECTFRTFF